MKRARNALPFIAVAAACVAGGSALVRESRLDLDAPAVPALEAPRPDDVFLDIDADSEAELARPDGSPAALDCSAVRLVVGDIRARFAGNPERPGAAVFAELVTSWLDPHGLWSAATDSPIAKLIEIEAEELLAEIEQRATDSRPCAAAERIGSELSAWVRELGGEFDRASASAPRLDQVGAAELALLSAFEDGNVTVPARELARELGRRVGATLDAFGSPFEPFARASRERYLPELGADHWARAVLAAALRGYIAAIDPHGGWAPLDEEWSLYADDPSFDDLDRLWGDMLRTAVGVRIVDRPTPPLEIDDLVLAVDGVPTAGLSVEQVEQLARFIPVRSLLGVRSVVVLRAGEHRPRELVFAGPELEAPEATEPEPSELGEELDLEFVPYGRGEVVVVSIRYVGDDLGDRLAEVVESFAREPEAPLGLLLDLRGNGGGSTDGAGAALGVFLPGVPAFPLLRRGQVMEVLSADPDPIVRYDGPLAVLVDGETASAAEMLAGAIDRYGRGLLIGGRTFGKGCVQEYSRDPAGAGVTRLTTRLFNLPDGSPVQRVGLVPRITLKTGEVLEREADLPGAIQPVPGPDVRRGAAAGPPWPPHYGRLGPCEDPLVCVAFARLAKNPRAFARVDAAGRKRRVQR